MTGISFINASTAVEDALALQTMKDLQTQITRDFYPVWGRTAQLDFVGKGKSPAKGTWWLSLLDNSDQAGALGYHDLTSEGLPIGKAFIKTCEQYGASWTVDASHEMLEMLCDPDINLICADANGSTLYAYEVGDPVQDDACGYMIEGTLASDFVYPPFFEPSRPANSARFSYGVHVHSPLRIAPGGYMSYMNINSAQGWQQVTEPGKLKVSSRAVVGSRRERRRTPKGDWLTSTAHQ